MPRGSSIFFAALGVTALHALDDGLISREPGVSVADHLVPVAATLALLTACALGWLRLGDGWRAAIALSLAPLLLTGFATAVSHASAAGAGGDDWTGFLLAPAGLACAGLGIETLWRSRRADGRPLIRRAARTLGAVFYAFWVLVPVTIALVATHRPRDADEPLDLGSTATELTLETSDGLSIAASYVDSRNGAAVILYPRRGGTDRQARMLVEHGYGVLTLDARGYGGSEGDPNAFGWGNTKDIDAAVSFLQARDDIRPDAIGGLGLSVGGEQMLDAASENEGLRAVVSEGAGERSVRETLIHGPAAALVLPQQAVLTVATALLSGDVPPPALDAVTARISPRAVFLIYAGKGAGGEELNPDYFEAAGQPKQIWSIEGSSHTGGIDAEPRDYPRRVIGFFDTHLGVR